MSADFRNPRRVPHPTAKVAPSTSIGTEPVPASDLGLGIDCLPQEKPEHHTDSAARTADCRSDRVTLQPRPASYASAAASRTASPQICLYTASSVRPANCEGHAPAGIYWFQGRAFDGSYQYLNLTYGCSLYYPSYQGDYVVVPADN